MSANNDQSRKGEEVLEQEPDLPIKKDICNEEKPKQSGGGLEAVGDEKGMVRAAISPSSEMFN
jgi:hypothetical protein